MRFEATVSKLVQRGISYLSLVLVLVEVEVEVNLKKKTLSRN
jgi:hypothetical protein